MGLWRLMRLQLGALPKMEDPVPACFHFSSQNQRVAESLGGLLSVGFQVSSAFSRRVPSESQARLFGFGPGDS